MWWNEENLQSPLYNTVNQADIYNMGRIVFLFIAMIVMCCAPLLVFLRPGSAQPGVTRFLDPRQFCAQVDHYEEAGHLVVCTDGSAHRVVNRAR